jgi:hypothetical protein
VLQNRRREPERSSAAFYLLVAVGTLFVVLFVVLPLVRLAS